MAAVHLRGDGARHDARRLLGAILGRSTAWLLANDTATLDSALATTFTSAIERRRRGEPVAYILGETGFFGLRFAVTPATLVPRPESEALVEAVVALAPASICDVGTGSGALAIAIATQLRDAFVVAIDVSADALEVAARNVAAHGAGTRIDLRCGDLLAPLRAGERFAAIVANLPYVPTAQLAAPPDPTSFEPRGALDGGADGLELYRRLLGRMPDHLTAGGTALFEAAPPTAEPLAWLARAAFPTATVGVESDYAGRARIVAIRPGRDGPANPPNRFLP